MGTIQTYFILCFTNNHASLSSIRTSGEKLTLSQSQKCYPDLHKWSLLRRVSREIVLYLFPVPMKDLLLKLIYWNKRKRKCSAWRIWIILKAILRRSCHVKSLRPAVQFEPRQEFYTDGQTHCLSSQIYRPITVW